MTHHAPPSVVTSSLRVPSPHPELPPRDQSLRSTAPKFPPRHCRIGALAFASAAHCCATHRQNNRIVAMGGTGKLRTCLLLVGLVVVMLGCGAQAVQFEVTARTTKCVAEEIQNHVVVVGDYKIVHSDEAHKLTVKVTSPYGNQLHYLEGVQSGQYAFTTTEAGNFMACFWLTNAPPNAVVNVALDWKTGVAAKDWASIAKKDKLDGMELELRKLEEAVGSIHSEMLYLREREAEMRDLNELTNSRVAWFGIMSLLVCLGVAGWQLWHLKTFFERKKLL